MQLNWFSRLTKRSKKIDLGRARSNHTVEKPVTDNRASRDNVFREATITSQDGHRLRAVVTDLSASGLRIRFYAKQTLSEIVQVRLQGNSSKRFARVVWQRGMDFGLQFLPEDRP
ncbi:PilZ domain-containing protein [Hyphomonas sp.]|uniref:PilZ domain-containing protein n=1 Tax=Hyphomonas sp. TaxID=87 RepID=UPI0035640B24